jgi:hypothetical protein
MRAAAGHAFQPETRHERDRRGAEERPRWLRVHERDTRREQSGGAQVLQQDADQVERGGDVDPEPPAPTGTA